MRTIFLTLSLLFSIVYSYGQEVVVTTGGNVQATGSISYTVGQVFYITSQDNSGSVLQGVQQSIELFSLSTDNSELLKSIKTSPNPTKDILVLRLQNQELNELRYILFDTNGKSLQKGKIDNENTFLNIKNFSAGVYLLKVLKNNTQLKTFKIIKN